MSHQNCGLSARSLAEISLIVSRIARTNLNDSTIPSAVSLRTFWQSSRSLEQRWLKILDDWTSAATFDIEVLTSLAPRVFTCEMLVRIWSTVMAGINRQHGSDDLSRLARTTVSSLARIRNAILSRLLTIPDDKAILVLQVDRLRRRCDRWNDVLVASLAVRCQCFDFAFDPDRARDFSEETSVANPVTGPNPAEHLIAAGLRLNFVRHLPTEPIDEPEIVSLLQSILSSIPGDALHRDGSYRTLLEQRIASSRQRLERRVAVGMSSFNAHNDA